MSDKSSNDYYGEHDHALKPNMNKIIIGDEEIEEVNQELIASNSHELVDGHEEEPKLSEEELILAQLRAIGAAQNPKHADKLYPLEILGAYSVVHRGMPWNFFKLGNPEAFIDNQINQFLSTADLDRFRNRLEREISTNPIVREGFKLRLNYAYLLEESTDEIQIHRGQKNKLLFYDALDEEGNYIGNLQSSSDLTDEQLDDMANRFYKNKETMKSIKNGTPKHIRDKILQLMTVSGMELEENLDAVYHALNKFNKTNLEIGLISRLAYVAFVTEINNLNIDQDTPSINDQKFDYGVIPPNLDLL